MKQLYKLFAVLALASASLLAQSNAVPLLYQLSPTSVKPGHGAFTLNVHGTGFVSGATVYWNGEALPTTFVSEKLIEAAVPASNVAEHGTASISVENAGGIASNVIYFTVRLGSSTVTLAAAATKIEPGVVTVADFNGDYIPDISVSGDHLQDYFYLDTYFGNGHGGFTKTDGPRFSSFDSEPGFLNVVGDFSNNGKMDVAMSNSSGDGTNPLGMLMFLGNGEGHFTGVPGGYAVIGTGAAADMNGDGTLDLVTQCYDGQPALCIYLGNGNGTFTLATTVYQNYGYGIPVVGDFNGDGKLDVAIPSGDWLAVFLGNGDGTVGAEVDYPMANATNNEPFAVVADVNGDGKLDVVTNTGNVMLGDGKGSFTHSSTIPFGSLGPITGQILIGDINGDGKLDVVTSVYETNAPILTIALGNGNGTFQTPLTYNLNIGGSIGMADFNNDGKLDFVGEGSPLDVVAVQK
jgi:hypothetical protein